MMTDIFGNKLQVGDKVVFTLKSTSCSKGYGLIKGTVATISNTGHACTVDYDSYAPAHIRLSDCIMKYDWTKDKVS